MGYYKRLTDTRADIRRYNATKRKADRLSGENSPRLIKIETVSEIERYTMAQNANRLTEFNKAVESWQDNVAAKLRTSVSSKSSRIAQELEPKAYTDKYGIINRLGFSFPRHGIYLHKGAGRGQGGHTGSQWSFLKTVNGMQIPTGIIRHTNPDSLGRQGEGNRQAFKWFDPIIEQNLQELADITLRYFDNMIIDASRIYIER